MPGGGTTIATTGYIPRWNGPGDSIVFSRGAPSLGVAIVSATGGGEHPVLEGISDVDWDPQHRDLLWARVVRDANHHDHGQIVTLGIDSGRLDTLLDSPTVAFRHPQFSPDGLSIAYARQRIDGDSQFELWTGLRQSLPGSQLIALSVTDEFAWRPGGAEIACIRYVSNNYNLDNNAIVIVDVASHQYRVVVVSPQTD